MSQSAELILEQTHLQIRAKLLEVGASLDRIDRAEGSVADDPRIQQFKQTLEVLSGNDATRAEQIQLIFSDQYQEGWNK